MTYDQAQTLIDLTTAITVRLDAIGTLLSQCSMLLGAACLLLVGVLFFVAAQRW